MTRQVAALLLAALWLGAALVTVAVVAPGAFAVLPTRALAGDMVGRVLPVLFVSAIIVHGAVLFVSPMARQSGLALWASLVAVVAAAIAQLVIDPRIAALRAAAVVPIDQLNPIDPRRAMFGALHGASVALLGIAMLANGVLLFALARHMIGRVPSLGEAR